MPCYRCGVRQTDPVRGPSQWKRGVRGGVQVLVCPDCQGSHDWMSQLDRCAACGSTMLVRLLGETQCRSCGAAGEDAAPRSLAAVAQPAVPTSGGGTIDLAGDVAAALDRLFGRA
jgi:hypothetical protein